MYRDMDHFYTKLSNLAPILLGPLTFLTIYHPISAEIATLRIDMIYLQVHSFLPLCMISLNFISKLHSIKTLLVVPVSSKHGKLMSNCFFHFSSNISRDKKTAWLLNQQKSKTVVHSCFVDDNENPQLYFNKFCKCFIAETPNISYLISNCVSVGICIKSRN